MVRSVAGQSLRKNRSKSCGCLKLEKSAARIRLLKPRGPKSGQFKGVGDLSGSLFSGIRSKAAARGIKCTVTIEELWAIYQGQGGKCAITGRPISLLSAMSRRVDGYTGAVASLDRIDSSGGYTPDNVQWVDKWVNFAKNSLTQDEFIELCRDVVKKADECKV